MHCNFHHLVVKKKKQRKEIKYKRNQSHANSIDQKLTENPWTSIRWRSARYCTSRKSSFEHPNISNHIIIINLLSYNSFGSLLLFSSKFLCWEKYICVMWIVIAKRIRTCKQTIHNVKKNYNNKLIIFNSQIK